MKLEMHAHTCEVSQCAVISAKELVDGYREAGYDGIVITNHFDRGTLAVLGNTPEEQYQAYLRGYELAKEEGDRIGLTVILGMEIRLNCGPEDFLVYGVTEDFIRKHMGICTSSPQELYEICRANNCLLIQAHPFRTPLSDSGSSIPRWRRTKLQYRPRQPQRKTGTMAAETKQKTPNHNSG